MKCFVHLDEFLEHFLVSVVHVLQMMLVDDQWCCAAVADVDVVADGDAFGGVGVVGVVDVVDLDFDIVDAVAVVVDIYRFDFVNGNVAVVVAVVVDIDYGDVVVAAAVAAAART